MGRWSARYAWARSDERAIRGPRAITAIRQIDRCGLGLAQRAVATARERDSTSTRVPHAGAGVASPLDAPLPNDQRSGPLGSGLPNCIIGISPSQNVPTGLVFRDTRALVLLTFGCISSFFRKLRDSTRVGPSAEFTWPNFFMEGV
jgi:hypothetical protein